MTTWPYPRIVAHRGGGALAPENTLGAIRLGASMGFKGVEFDVMLAGDGTPVIIHDETVDRTTNGHGEVPKMTYLELAKLRIEKNEGIPTFKEAAGLAVAPLARELWRGAALPPVLSSFSLEALDAAREAAPELPRGYLVEKIPPDWRDTMKRLECVALHCNYKSLSEELAVEIHGAGYSILLWTVNDPIEAQRLLKMGADCLVTDALNRISPDFQ